MGATVPGLQRVRGQLHGGLLDLGQWMGCADFRGPDRRSGVAGDTTLSLQLRISASWQSHQRIVLRWPCRLGPALVADGKADLELQVSVSDSKTGDLKTSRQVQPARNS